MKFIFSLLILLCGSLVFGAANTSQVNALAYASTNVTTSAYVQLISSTAITASKIQVCDTSGKVLKIASGAASSELDLLTVQVSGCVIVPYYIVAGTRLSIKAIDASATTGYNTVALIP